MKLLNKILSHFKNDVPARRVIQQQAVLNFWYANHNLGKMQLVRDAFKGCHEQEVTHLEQLMYDANYDLFAFMVKLDAGNRTKLIAWVMDNYQGYNIQQAKGDVMENIL